MRKLALSLLILLQVCALSAIGFGYHVFELHTEPEFSDGVFPSSVVYQFNFPMVNLVEGSESEVAARLDAGLDFRQLRQNPDDGSFYAENPVDFDLDYMAMYGEISLFYSQGFLHKAAVDKDFITLYASFDVRFEHAYETLDWMSDSDHTDGLFKYVADDGSRVYRFSGSSWTGAPELKGKRQTTQLSLTFAFTMDYLREGVTDRDGVSFKSWWRWTPENAPLATGNSGFIASYNTVQLSKTLLYRGQAGKDLSWVSIVLDDFLTYRILWGDKIPVYIQGGDIWGDSDVPNLQHAITNRLALTVYGPQVLVPDFYPSLTLFLDLGWGLGKAMNSKSDETYFEFVSSYGLRGELVMYNICSLFFELGCVVNPAFNEDHYVKGRAGFQLGI